MVYRFFVLPVLFLGFAACSQAADVASNSAKQTEDKATEKLQEASSKKAAKPSQALTTGADISTAPAGTYKPLGGHAYITFQYLHQGYARPTLRWNEFDAQLNLNPEAPEQSSLSVTIDASSIDSGVEAFDDHLVSADFFNVDEYPEITFTATNVRQNVMGVGTLEGDLTIKGITKAVTLDVTLNKVGEHFRNQKPLLGISATTKIKRSDWDMGKYAPAVGDDVDISVEIEFIKDEE